MKKLIVVSVIMAVMLLMGSFFAPVHAQDPAKEEKPTFYELVPGTYVNGWPRFTITYPKDWLERLPFPHETFRAEPPGRTGEMFVIVISQSSQTLEKCADRQIYFFKNIAKARDVILLSDKPSRLRDGTPAQEVEIQAVLEAPVNLLALATKKGDMFTTTEVGGPNVRIGEDLKAILYSLQYEPGRDEPVKVPPDIQEFLDKFCSDLVSHDVTKVMTHYSNKYLSSGERKGEAERRIRGFIGFVTSFQYSITDFITAGDRVYLTGFVSGNSGRTPLKGTSIIKENGEWKWYGNQRDVSP
jgi:hypothetical protein